MTIWDNPESGSEWSGFSTEILIWLSGTLSYDLDLPLLVPLLMEEKICYSFLLLVLLYFFPNPGEGFERAGDTKESQHLCSTSICILRSGYKFL